MRSTIPIALAALLGALALTGCGSGGTKTVSVSSAVGAGAGTSATGATGTTGANRKPSSPTVGGTKATHGAAGETTRTATAPAFAKEPSGGEGLSQAIAVVKAHGYAPGNTSDYHVDQTLRVLLATRTGSADGYAQQAFFFVGGRYIGTDTSAPSAGIRLVSQGDTEATLAYRLYQPGDPLCCARDGEATVRFQLNNGRLVALDPIPPASSSTAASRQ
ncbi:MAG TPA: LppP/LprE family lipoprotein [Solirubrobacteraceae bacterium]|nr:LppP/LprE family lipoprotein [Solirubrobacteraceae bacterium]